MLKFILLTLISFQAFANSEDYLQCGPPPGLISRLLTDAEEIRIKCIDQIYEANQEKVRKEVQSLSEVSKQLDEEIQRTAITRSHGMVQCVPSRGQTRDPKLVKRCQDAVANRAAVIDRIDRLMGWKQTYTRSSSDSKESRMKGPQEFPCPSPQEMEKMRVARAFHKRLNEMWTRCQIDSQL